MWRFHPGASPRENIFMPFIGIKKCRKRRTLRQRINFSPPRCLQIPSIPSNPRRIYASHARSSEFQGGSIAVPAHCRLQLFCTSSAAARSSTAAAAVASRYLNSDLLHHLALNSHTAYWLIEPNFRTLLPIARRLARVQCDP